MPIKRVFLSFGAVLHALNVSKLSIGDFDDSLIFCTDYDVNHADNPSYDEALVVLTRARNQQRLHHVPGSGTDDPTTFSACGNPTTFGEVNEFLLRHQVAPLLIAGGAESTPLSEIPLHSAIPGCTDRSVEILWAASHKPKPFGGKLVSSGAQPKPKSKSQPSNKPPGDSSFHQAVRQAGYAWVAYTLGVTSISLQLGPEPLTGEPSYCQLDLKATQGVIPRELARRNLLIIIGGYMALQMVTEEKHSPLDAQLPAIETYVRVLLGHKGRTTAINEVAQKTVRREIRQLIQAYELEVRGNMSEHTLAITRIAKVLVERQTITAEQWADVLAES